LRRFPVILNIRLNCLAEKMCDGYPTSLSFEMYRCPPMLGADCRKNWTACGAIFSPHSVHLGLFAAAFENCKIIDTTNWLNCFWFYRANQLPEQRKTAELWRREAKRAGLPGLYLVRVESFSHECGDPRDIGFDTALEFQPRGSCSTEQGFVGGSGGIYESSVHTNQACGKTLLWTTGDW